MKNPLDYLKRTVDNVENRFKTIDVKDDDSMGMLKIEIATAESGIKLGKDSEKKYENLPYYNVLKSRINNIKEAVGFE